MATTRPTVRGPQSDMPKSASLASQIRELLDTGMHRSAIAQHLGCKIGNVKAVADAHRAEMQSAGASIDNIRCRRATDELLAAILATGFTHGPMPPRNA